MVGCPEVASASLAIIERLNAHGVRASVLTKGILPRELADARFDRGNTLGISLVSLAEGFRRRFEPGAAPYRERVAGLERLHGAGCRTLVHRVLRRAPGRLGTHGKKTFASHLWPGRPT
jgi:DNA repair photolyase